MTHDEAVLRRELAAAFRWTARFNWHESVANHFSAVIPGDEQHFLLNPIGAHFSRIRASSLVRLEVSPAAGGRVDPTADPTAWHLHANLHRLVPRAKVALHTHQPYATALACLDGYEFQMLDQNACRFHGRIAYDRDYGGMFLDGGEGERVASLLGDDKAVLMLGNHGVLVIGNSVAEAFEDLYYLERASYVQVLALSTGQRLSVLSDEVASLTCRQWFSYPAACDLHLRALMEILDVDEPGYAD